MFPPVILNSLRIPQAEDAKYLELHLDRRLNWKNIYLSSENNLDYNWRKCTGYSAVNHNYQNKLLLYKEILKPIWIYGI